MTKGGRARATASVCLTTGSDGACGSSAGAPAGAAGTGPVAGAGARACVTSGGDGRCGTRDREPPRATIAGLRTGRTFARARAPRLLGGTVGVSRPAGQAGAEPDPSGLLMVKLRLTRRDRGRCTTFSGRRERFVGARCGAANGTWFRIGDRARWSYLLPARLPRGRYVLDVKAIDRAYNRDETRETGRNRVGFRVR